MKPNVNQEFKAVFVIIIVGIIMASVIAKFPFGEVLMSNLEENVIPSVEFEVNLEKESADYFEL